MRLIFQGEPSSGLISSISVQTGPPRRVALSPATMRSSPRLSHMRLGRRLNGGWGEGHYDRMAGVGYVVFCSR